MATPAIKLAEPPDAASQTLLEKLLDDRSQVAQGLSGLQASAARLRAAATSEAGILAEIGELGRAEIGAMTAWASAGCLGDAPAPDQKQRTALATRLATAQASSAAATGSLHDLDHQISELTARLHAVNGKIDHAVFDQIEREHALVIDQYRDAAAHVAKLAAKIHGLANFFGETGRNLNSRGDRDAGGAYLQRAERLTKTKLPSPGVTQGEILQAANEWAGRANALRKGARS